MCIATNGSLAMPLSSQEMCFCASLDGCGGGDLTTPWVYIQLAGKERREGEKADTDKRERGRVRQTGREGEGKRKRGKEMDDVTRRQYTEKFMSTFFDL